LGESDGSSWCWDCLCSEHAAIRFASQPRFTHAFTTCRSSTYGMHIVPLTGIRQKTNVDVFNIISISISINISVGYRTNL
jgi:hypothetical protein